MPHKILLTTKSIEINTLLCLSDALNNQKINKCTASHVRNPQFVTVDTPGRVIRASLRRMLVLIAVMRIQISNLADTYTQTIL